MVDYFRRGDVAHDARLLAAQGALSTSPKEQIALLVLLSDDPDTEIAATAAATIGALPERALRGFLAQDDVAPDTKQFFADRGVTPANTSAAEAGETLFADDGDDPDETAGADGSPALLSGLPIKQKVKLAAKGTREQRAQLVRDPNKLVAAAVLSSPKLTDAEVEAFARMQNVSEEVLRVIGTNRAWLKNYGVALGLVKNAKTPIAISMQLLPRIAERDMKMLAVDRNVPEALRLTARKFMVKTLR
jgi:hypothetical protein